MFHHAEMPRDASTHPIAGSVLRHASSTRRSRALATREQLIATTIRLMHERSYGSATFFEVAKAAGVTHGALQHHFGSRAMLMLEVLRTILESNALDDRLAWPDSGLSVEARAQQFVQVLWDQLYEPPRFLAAWSVYFGAAGDGALRPRMAEMRVQLASTLRQRFARVFPETQGLPARESFVDLVLSTLRGLGVARLFHQDPLAERAQLQMLAMLIAQWCTGRPGTETKDSPRLPRPAPARRRQRPSPETPS